MGLCCVYFAFRTACFGPQGVVMIFIAPPAAVTLLTMALFAIISDFIVTVVGFAFPSLSFLSSHPWLPRVH